MTELANQIRTAVQAVLLMSVAIFARTGPRLDGPSQDRSRRCVTDRLEIRHDQSPCSDIMRGPALMLAPQ
jgi:hypothetical protein